MIKKNTNVYDLFEDDRPEEFSYQNVDGGIRIVSYAGSKSFVKIPEEINGIEVVEIGGSWVSSVSPAILLPKTLSRFDPDAFDLIKEYWLTGDYWFDDVYMNEDNPYFKLKEGILYNADMTILYFCFNRTIKEYQMPNTVEIVKKGAFRAVEDSDLVEKISWSENLRVIEDFAFFSASLRYSGWSMEPIRLPASVKSLGLMSFSRNTDIELDGEIEFLSGCPAGWFNINNDYYVTDDQILFTADKKIAIGYSSKSNSLRSSKEVYRKDLIFWGSTEIIMPYAFCNLGKLKELNLGTTVRKIGSHAFREARIKTIRIPAQVEEIADDAFGYKDCSSIIVDKANTHFASDRVCLYRLNEDGSKTLMKCFKGVIELYEILDGTSDILDNAFSTCGSLSILELPNSIKRFDGNCLKGTSVKTIMIPTSVQNLDNMAGIDFALDKDNPYFIFEDEVLYQEREDGLVAVAATNNATSITLKEGTVEVANFAFFGCSKVKELALVDSLVKIGRNSFSGCAIETISFNDGLRIIDDCAFEDCKIQSVELPGTVEYVCRTAFDGCPLTKYKVHNSYYKSDDGILYSADKKILIDFPMKKKCDSFNIPASVEHIGQALYGCCIEQIVLPNSLRALSEYSLDCGASDIGTGRYLVSISESCLGNHWNLRGKSLRFQGYPDTVMPNYVMYLQDYSLDLKLKWFGLESITSLCKEFEVVPDGEDGLAILEVKSDGSSLVIPAVIGKYPVTMIHDSALKDKEIKSLTISSPNTIVNSSVLQPLEKIVLPVGLKEISAEAFKNCKMTSITIPEGVEVIGNNAFDSCESLTSIAIPQSVKKIGDSAFKSCYKLKNMDIPVGIEVIGDYAFEYCRSLTSVLVPGSMRVLSKQVFASCRSLKSVTIEEGVERIEEGVFYACESLEKVIFPSSVREINKNLFGDEDTYYRMNPDTIYITVPGSFADTFLKTYQPEGSVELYLNVLSLEDCYSNEPLETFNSFVYEPNGEGTVHVMLNSSVEAKEANVIIPDTIGNKTVTELSFVRDSGRIRESIESIEIPASVERISELSETAFKTPIYVDFKNIFVAEDNANYWSDGKALYSKDRTKFIHLFAYNLQEYELIDGVREVCDGAFSYQKKIARIVLPDSIDTIGDYAFYGCESLNQVVGAEKMKNVAANAFDYTPYLSHAPAVIFGTVFERFNGTEESTVKIPEGITEIADRAFYYGNENVERIKLPSTLKIINKDAFSALYKLTKINIPNGVEMISSRVFNDTNLKKIDLPATVKSIASDAFPESLKSINVDPANEVYASKDGILYSKDMKTLYLVPARYSINKVILPGSLKRIADYAFYNNRTISEVVLPDSLSEIGQGAFRECAQLKTINLDSVKTIRRGAFSGCKALTDVSLSCKEIEWATFSGCGSLANVTLVNTEIIEMSAFEGCAINSIEFPSTLTEIESYAFEYCNFASVTIPKTVKQVGTCAFYGSKHIYIYDTLQSNAGDIGFSYSREHPHIITVLSADNDQIKYSVMMDSDGSTEHSSVLKDSWGPGATFNFRAFDNYFANIKKAEIKLSAAISRLEDPIDLSDVGRQTYVAYVVRNAKAVMKNFIDANDLDSFSFFESFGTIKKANIDELIEYAVNKQAVAFSAFLMDYKEKNFSSKKSTKKSLSLGSTRTVAPWQIRKNTIGTLERYRGSDVDLMFPTEVDGKTISKIADATATVPDNYKEIISVAIPEGYVSIGDNAFRGCENLERISLPSTLKELGKRVFAGCGKLQEIVLPKGITDIGAYCFEKCTGMKTIKLPLKIKSLEQGAFQNCSSLTSIDLPRGLKYIEKDCFSLSGLKSVAFRGCNPWIAESAFHWGVSFIGNKNIPGRDSKEVTLWNIPSELLSSPSYDRKGLYYRYSFAAEGAGSAYNFTPIEKIEFAGKRFLLTGLSPSDANIIKKEIVKKGGGIGNVRPKNVDYLIVDEDHEKTRIYYRVVYENSFWRKTSIISLATFKKLSNISEEAKKDPEVQGTDSNKSDSELWLEEFGAYVEVEPQIEFEGKLFVFTGLTKSHEAAKQVLAKGGEYRSSISSKTDYLIVNPENAGKTKISEAIEQRKKGSSIKVIVLDDLISNMAEK